VLEGSLELEIRRDRLRLIAKSFVAAFVPIVALSFALAFLLQHLAGATLRMALINAIPFAIVSSAIAIPSVRHLDLHTREFTIYESSFSDIIGVLFFNFVAFNTVFDASLAASFSLQFVATIVLSLAATLLLAFLLSKITHHVKFIPIILFTVLIYSIFKACRLPELIFILIFGLFLRNIEALQRLRYFGWIERLNLESLRGEIVRLKDLVSESSFLIRSLFFLLFGYLIDNGSLLNPATLVRSAGISAGIFLIRWLQLLVLRVPMRPMLFIAPRGLITILLFLSVVPRERIAFMDNSVVIQVIIITSLTMMTGLMATKKEG
jgi:hypothetical protein